VKSVSGTGKHKLSMLKDEVETADPAEFAPQPGAYGRWPVESACRSSFLLLRPLFGEGLTKARRAFSLRLFLTH
jgi:hypothetical protein